MNTKSAIHFSLIVATVNRVQETERLLASLSHQNYNGTFDVIIVDQNPDDRLNAMVERYQQYFPITHLRQDQALLARARNQGIAYMTGDYVGFPDDDCVYEVDTLSKAAQFLVEHAQYAGVVGNVLDLDCDEEAILLAPAPAAGVIDYDKAWMVGMTAAFFMHAKYVKNNRFDETIGPGTFWGCGEDADFLLRCMDQGATFYFTPQLVVRHPSPIKIYTTWQLAARYFRYGRGTGYLMGKRQFTVKTALKVIIEPLLMVGFFIANKRWKDLPSLPTTTLGRLIGYAGYYWTGNRSA